MVEEGYVVQRNIRTSSLFQENKPRLGHLDIELTERCNNACQHCYINLPADDTRAKRRELTTDGWKDLLCQAADLGALTVRLTGGEPLLREDFSEIYIYARRLGLEVVLFTNARLITPELADLFARVPPRQPIEISVYGMHAESYDAVACSAGAFIEFQKGANLLLERKIPFVVKSVLLPPTCAEMDQFEDWAATIPWMDKPPAYAFYLDLRARRDSPSKNRRIKDLRYSPEESMTLRARHEDLYRNDMAQFCSRFIQPPGDRLFSCGAGEAGCVDAYGIYQMCMLLRHPDTVYDLKQGTLRQALTEVFPRFRQTRATNPAYLRRCARCFLKGLCEQCPGKSWAEHGTLDTPVEYLCQVAHAQARYLGMLAEKEQAWEVTDWRQRIETVQNFTGSEQQTGSEQRKC
jgi:radical SAM protein with 4Fe4S-binding SPASM domain